MEKQVLTAILAGGKGTRLDPLTRDRAKPAVPFGGQYRIIDFTLSNCINSNLRRVRVLTQFKSYSLNKHIRNGWGFLCPDLDESIEILPPQQRIDDHWYRGTADAIYQNIYSFERERATELLVLAGDHIYTMDYSPMIAKHRETNADVTIACIPVPVGECNQFGIVTTEADGRIVDFHEKPASCHEIPNDPGYALGSMGIYVFNMRTLFERLFEDATNGHSSHDFGKDVIPKMLNDGSKVFAHRVQSMEANKRPYWRDVGTLDALYDANLDLVQTIPQLNLYDPMAPVRTFFPPYPPAKIVHDAGPHGEHQRGVVVDSLVSPGCIVSGGMVSQSILSPNVRVNHHAAIEESVIFENVVIGHHCQIRKTIIDKGVKVPANVMIGFDADLDRRRGLTVTANGITVVPNGHPANAFDV